MSATVACSRAAASTSCSRGGQRARALAERRRGEAGIDDALAAHRAADGARERLGGRVLEQEAGGALLHGAAQVAGPAEGGEDEDLAVGQLARAAGRRPRGRRRRASRCRAARRRGGARAPPRGPRRRAPTCGHDLDVGLEREQAARARRGPSPGPRRAARGSPRGRYRHHSAHAEAGPSSRGPASRRPPACAHARLEAGEPVAGAVRARRGARAVVDDLDASPRRAPAPGGSRCGARRCGG